MNINISDIVTAKIAELEANKIIETAIADTFEKTIVKSVVDALDSYSLKRSIEEKVSKQVSDVVNDLDFTSYNGFIVDKMKQIVEETCRQDLQDKITTAFTNMFITKKDSLKLSEIFNKYREIVCENVEESEKYDRQTFHLKCKTEEGYGWINCELDEEDDKSRYSDIEIKFTVHRNHNDKNTGWIGSVYLNGTGLDKTMKFGHLNDVELMIVNASYNKTPIIIDVEDEDDLDNSYDVDY